MTSCANETIEDTLEDANGVNDFVEHLFSKLKQNSESDFYPYHMPGHKRRPWGEIPAEFYGFDITEIEGFDNLHQAENLLKELQEKAAKLYGAEESFYLINGSSCGILSAVSAAVPEGGHILMARNCHKSAYHAAYLRGLRVSYLYPAYMPEYDICDAITAEQVAVALEHEPDIQAVLIVSPTYEGRIANVEAIAEVVHQRGIPLIVDEAHGAHLGFAKGFAENSCRAGADLVIHSVHKTLPALTQTALLHVNGSLIHRDILRRFLHIYQSSSPSHILMASIDNALQYIEKNGARAFADFSFRYGKMLDELEGCEYLKILKGDCMEQDVGKLLISVKALEEAYSVSEEAKDNSSAKEGSLQRLCLSGKQLYDILLDKYHLQLEMASETYALAMFTVNDGEEAYFRMTKALLEIDADIHTQIAAEIDRGADALGEKVDRAISGAPDESMTRCPEEGFSRGQDELLYCEKLNGMVQCDTDYVTLSLSEAWDCPRESALLEGAVGKYAAEFVNLYPPGIPILVPGELITAKTCEKIIRAYSKGLKVQGIEVVTRGIQATKPQNGSVVEASNRVTDSHGLQKEDIYINILRDMP